MQTITHFLNNCREFDSKLQKKLTEILRIIYNIVYILIRSISIEVIILNALILFYKMH